MKKKALIVSVALVVIGAFVFLTHSWSYRNGYYDGQKAQIHISNFVYENALTGLKEDETRIAEGLIKLGLLWSLRDIGIAEENSFEGKSEKENTEYLRDWIKRLHIEFNLFEITEYQMPNLTMEEHLNQKETDAIFTVAQSLDGMRDNPRLETLKKSNQAGDDNSE